MVMPAVPHPFGDTSARWFYVLINELVARGHELAVVAATEEAETRVAEAREKLAKHEGKLTLHFHRLKVDAFALRRKWENLVRPRSEMLQDRELRELLDRELRRGCDVLHLELLSAGWLGVGQPRALLNVHSFDAIDWSERANMTAGERKALWQAQRATDRLLHEIPNVRLLTPRLKEAAQAINPAGRYWVVPFALDTALYRLLPPATEPVVGMIGSMHWEPSRSAARRLITRIWPLVKQRVPAARLYIAGWNAAKYLSDCASQPDVVLAENLEHPTEFFSKAAVMVYAPSRGSGMKVKVMESMAYGVPVVTTWEGMEGMEYQNGRECWVAESDEGLAEKVCRLLENPAERGQMRQAARSLMDERYSPRPVVDKMISVYEELIGSRTIDSPSSL
jgi:glycosyltransferase involved in cell wall biosynthesis